MSWKSIFLAVIALPLFAQAFDQEERQRLNQQFNEAREKEQKGDFADAFWSYLDIPGAEFAASNLARKYPDIAKKLLGKIDPAPPATPLVKAELLLSAGKNKEALEKFRTYAKGVAHGYYPVEPTQIRLPGWEANFSRWNTPALPFELGPGSHVDNWLIRRFIALEAWEDAAAEFARVQRLHDERPGPDPLALQFALDHAFFLKERGEEDEARALLAALFPKIDLDRRHRIAGFGHWSRPGVPLGVSHDEFIRLAYGAIKTAGKGDALIGGLTAAKEIRTKRVLAKILTHEGKLDDALKLELDYIGAGKFSPVSTAIRQGSVYETFKRHADAAAAFEKALTLPPESALDLPAEPRDPYGAIIAQFAQAKAFPGATTANAAYREMVLTRLESAYEAMGNPDKVLTTRLRRWDENPNWANTFQSVEALSQLAKTTSLDADFRAWVRNARADTKKFSPAARANLSWVLDDIAGTLGALGEAGELSKGGISDLDGWIRRMEARGGKEQSKKLLEILVAADPEYTRYRLALLNLAGDDTSDETLTALYESLLAPDAEPAFSRGKGGYNHTQFDNYFDLAHRLMRLYVKRDEREKMERLGLRMAKAEKPFTNPDAHNDGGHSERAMAFLISEAGPATHAALEPLLTEKIWPRGKAQLGWTLAGGVAGSLKRFTPQDKIPWHGTAGAKVIVSDENVLDLARNGSFVFAGQPWGVSAYDFAGNLVRRIAIGDAALCLAADENTLWVGTPYGLRRVDLKTWIISQMRCDHEIPDETRAHADYNRDFHNGVVGLALKGGTLWIGSRQNVRTLNTKTGDLRVFSKVEMGMKNHADWEWFLFEDDGKVWANSSSGSRRYDPKSDSWQAPVFNSPRDPTRLIGMIDGVLWADVYIDDQLRHRPAILDPVSLRAEPVRISAAASPDQRNYLTDFQFYGRQDGRLVFGPEYPAFTYNPETNLLDPLPDEWDRDILLEDSPLPPKHRHGYSRTRHDGTMVGEYKTLLPLPDGSVVLGAQLSRSPRYIYPGEDWPFQSMVWEMKDDSGGLHWFAPGKDPRRVSGGGLSGDTVFDALPSDLGIWLATSAGIALANSDGEVIETFGRGHGIPVNRSSAAAELDGKIYFACRHGDHDGALVVFDPKSSRFNTLSVVDGLSSNAVESVSAEDGNLIVHFGVEYRRNYRDFGYHQFPPQAYDPASGLFSKRPAEPQIFDQRTAGARAKREPFGALPLLGGSIIAKRTFGDKTWLIGTRGVVILSGADAPHEFALSMPEIEVLIDPNSRHELIAEARRIRGERDLPFVAGITHANPFVVANTIARVPVPMSPEHAKAVAAKLNSKMIEIRSTAATQLYRDGSPEAVKALRGVLGDPNPEIRAMAAIAVTKRAEDPLPTEALADIFSSRSIGNPHFGAEGSMGLVPGAEEAYRALATRGEKCDAEVFELLLRFPPRLGNWDSREMVFPFLGAAVRRDPNIAKILLSAKDTRTGGTTDRDFARDVFLFTGPEVLPVLHEALKSEDRIVRANAALNCGAVGDAASIPKLLDALDLESGLSKGAIVWALGELGAVAAIPRMTDLYLEARTAEKRLYNSGIYAAQAAVVHQQERRELASVESLRADWDEIKAATERADAPADPRHEEPLLSPGMILDALRKIGPEHAQEFYRGIAADNKDGNGRYEAARMLSHADDSEREASIAALRILTANRLESRAQAAACVSLLLLGDDGIAKPAILRSLGSNTKSYALAELSERVADKSKLAFARNAIRAIANDPAASRHVRETARSLAP